MADPDSAVSDKQPSIFLTCALLALSIWLVFGQTLRHGFVNFDDQVAVFENRHVTSGANLKELWWVFTHVDVNFYTPLTTASHMFDWRFYHGHSGGHHLTNVILHTFTAILLLLFLVQTTRRIWPSAFVAAVFAVHPLHVESVAWVTERKDTLSGAFFMLTLFCYTNYLRKRSAIRYGILLITFILGLLSKPSLVTLPFVLLLLDYWPLRRLEGANQTSQSRVWPSASFWQVLVEKIPLIACCLAASVLAFAAEGTAVRPIAKYPILLRIGNALVSYWTYLRQTFWPTKLAAFYPFPVERIPLTQVVAAAIIILAATLAAFTWRRQYPAAYVGWLWFCGMLVPMIGLVQIGDFAHADRFMYLPQIGLLIATAWLVPSLAGRLHVSRQLVTGLAVLSILSLMICAHTQASYWHDSELLWKHAIATTSENALAHNDLGLALQADGHVDEAAAQFREALSIRPDYPEAHNNLGVILRKQGSVDEAMTHFREALTTRLKYAEAHSNLGNALLQKGRYAEARTEYFAAIKDDPRLVSPHNNLALLLTQQGQTHEAVLQYRAAIAIDPYDPSAINNLAWLLATTPDQTIRDGAEAIKLAERAISLTRGANPASFDSLAAAYAETGRFDEAIAIATRARDLAAMQHDVITTAGIDDRIRRYQNHLPYRDDAKTETPH